MSFSISSDGTEDGWDFPRNGPKAEVSFSKIFIQLLLAGLRTEHFFDECLAREKSLVVRMPGVAPVGKRPVVREGVFPKQTAILKSSNIFVNRIFSPRTHLS